MRRARIGLIVLALSTTGVLAGCGATAEATPAASPIVLEVTLDDTLAMTPAAFTVRRGVPVRFVVTNEGATQHEFVLGDEAAQAEHEQEMASGGMSHAHANALMVDPGETKELEWRFETAGEVYAGCHYPGHYAAGMKATISVVE